MLLLLLPSAQRIYHLSEPACQQKVSCSCQFMASSPMVTTAVANHWSNQLTATGIIKPTTVCSLRVSVAMERSNRSSIVRTFFASPTTRQPETTPPPPRASSLVHMPPSPLVDRKKRTTPPAWSKLLCTESTRKRRRSKTKQNKPSFIISPSPPLVVHHVLGC